MEDVTAQLVRASLALRGIRPTAAEHDIMLDDPRGLAALVDGWLVEPEFAATVRDLHAETWLTRMTHRDRLPASGVLAWADRGALASALGESTLVFAERVVVDRRPYTELVTAEETWVDEHVALVLGLPFEAGGPEWQIGNPVDGRSAAGILSQDTLWMRHITGDANRQRARAEFIADRLLCDPFSTRDLPVTDLSGSLDAVSVDPACTSCHEDLDPIASTIFGFRRYVLSTEMVEAYANGCEDPAFCYPIQMWVPETEGTGPDWGMPEPGWFGEPLANVGALGLAVAQDPRFASCTARRFRAWLHQVDPDSLDDEVVQVDADALVASDWDAAALLRDLVLADDFVGTEAVGPLAVRPESLARQVEAATGFGWHVNPHPFGCTLLGCSRDVDLLNDARDGFRVLAGGIDGYDVIEPSLAPAPTRALVVRRLAEGAADFVVDDDFGKLAEDRRLLTLIERDGNGENKVRAQLVALHLRLLGERVTPISPAVDEDVALWGAVFFRSGGSAAWRAVIAALLQDPRAVTY